MAALLLLVVLVALVVIADRLIRRRAPAPVAVPEPVPEPPVVVEAVLSARPPKDTHKGARYESAMRAAVEDCLAQGIPLDDPRVRDAVLAARDAMRASYR